MKEKTFKSVGVLCVMMLAGCSAFNDEPAVVSDAQAEYLSISEMDMGKEPIPTLPDKNFNLEYLLSLTDEQLDSVHRVLKRAYLQEEIDSIAEISLDALIDRTSAEEVSALYSVIGDYAKNGGHNIEWIQSETATLMPEIREIAIETASLFDEFTGTAITVLLQNEDTMTPKECRIVYSMTIVWAIAQGVYSDGLEAGASLVEATAATVALRACEKTGVWYL